MASITGGKWSGGIVGLGNTKGMFIECKNSGEVTGANDDAMGTGGICRILSSRCEIMQ